MPLIETVAVVLQPVRMVAVIDEPRLTGVVKGFAHGASVVDVNGPLTKTSETVAGLTSGAYTVQVVFADMYSGETRGDGPSVTFLNGRATVYDMTVLNGVIR